MNILLLLIGLALILFGAQFLVDGASAVARRYRMSQFLIGLTIVGIGTSMPELVVSLVGTIAGQGDIAIGNIAGSNTANVLLILGVTALVRPIPISRSTLRTDLPFNIFVNVLLLLFAFGFMFWKTPAAGVITRWEGIAFLALFVFFLWYSFRQGRTGSAQCEVEQQEEDTVKKPINMWLASLMIVGGLAGLIFGGRFFVNGAVGIARAIGASEAFIAITLMALGTSLPELATSVVAAVKGNTQLALGNIIGSNISNITLIIGTCATVRPLATGGITPVDILMPLLAGVILFLTVFTFKGRKVNRIEGAFFLLIYLAYIYVLASKI